MTDTAFIYVLKDPRTGEIRYVGKAQDPDARLSVHLASKEKNHRANWIKSLRTLGLRPALEIVAEVPFIEWPMWEVAYIQFFKDEGCNLVNGTSGGEGSMNPSEETKEKRRIACAGRKCSEEHKARTSVSLMGHLVSPETTQRRKETMILNGTWGNPLPEPARKHLVIKNLGKVYASEGSGCAGVYWNKQDQNWRASITIDNRYVHLGVFKNKEDAIKVRKEHEESRRQSIINS